MLTLNYSVDTFLNQLKLINYMNNKAIYFVIKSQLSMEQLYL